MAKAEVELISGLQGREAQKFVDAAGKFTASIHLVNKSDRSVDAKSILGIMSLGIEKGDKVTLITEGEDADQALSTLTKLLEE